MKFTTKIQKMNVSLSVAYLLLICFNYSCMTTNDSIYEKRISQNMYETTYSEINLNTYYVTFADTNTHAHGHMTILK